MEGKTNIILTLCILSLIFQIVTSYGIVKQFRESENSIATLRESIDKLQQPIKDVATTPPKKSSENSMPASNNCAVELQKVESARDYYVQCQSVQPKECKMEGIELNTEVSSFLSCLEFISAP